AQGPQGPQGAAGPAGSSSATASVSGVEPASAFLARKSHVTVSGYATSWTDKTTLDFGAGVTVANVHAASPTALVADITIDKAAALGVRDVVVTDGANKETYKQAFTVTAPAVVTMEGALAQGAIVIANVELQDQSTPFDTTGSQDPFTGAVTYTNLNLATPAGVTGIIESATSNNVQLLLTIDVDADTKAADFDLLSGAAGDPTDVEFPVPGALTVAARTAVALAAQPASGTIKTAYDSALYSYTPGGATSIVDLTATSAVSGANAGFALLPKSGHFADLLGFFQAANGATTSATTTLVPTTADPYYAIYWDNSGTVGDYTMGATSTTPAATAPTTANDGSKPNAVVATALPFVLTGGNLTDTTSQDWVKVTLAANTTLRVTTAGDVLNDIVVTLYANDGTTTVGGGAVETGGPVDTTFPVTTAGTYYVVFSAGIFFDPTHGTYDAALRLQ
ncbi:MAG: hypothetical protein ACRELB_16600, partial [Polyangiaceae bacterium]